MSINGITTINIELTSRCNKHCWMCGRRKIDRDYPELVLNYGDMEFELVEKIAHELPNGITVQLHNNGESLLYPRFGDAVRLLNKNITNVVTNGKLLLEKSDEIIDNLDTMTVSIFEEDKEADEQYEILTKFLRLKGDRKPLMILRLNGNIKNEERYKELNLICAKRTLHAPEGSFNYRLDPTVPEIGVCLDFLHHPAINKDGDFSICVRFDPKRLGVLCNIKSESISKIWKGIKRNEWLNCHLQGNRNSVPLCSYCHYWGVPTGGLTTNIKHIDLTEVSNNWNK